jgi:hypothetical protein
VRVPDGMNGSHHARTETQIIERDQTGTSCGNQMPSVELRTLCAKER